MMFDHLLLVIYRVSAVYSIEFDLVDVLKKFIKGFGLLFFGRTQHIGFYVDFCLVVYCVSALDSTIFWCEALFRAAVI